MAHKLYRIGDAAELLGLKAYVLRYWETEFFQLRPVRTGKGQRRYTEADVATLGRIRYLLHDQGLTIEGARRVLAGESALSLNDGPVAAVPPSCTAAPSASEPIAAAPAAKAEEAADMPDAGKSAAVAEAQSAASAREKPAGKPVQLSLSMCLAKDCSAVSSLREPEADKCAQPSEQKEDDRSEALRRIADELRDLRRLLRQG